MLFKRTKIFEYQGFESSENSLAKVEKLVEEEVEEAPTIAEHIFSDPRVAQDYKKKLDEAEYDGRHHFDATLEWSLQEERRVLSRTDIYVTFFAFVLFFAQDLDRHNMVNAVSGTFLQDLKLTTNDYNIGNTINTVCFLVAEIPSQMLSKKIGAHRWIPIQMVAWSIVATLQCLLKNRAQFLATRAILGVLEGGFIPCMCLWLSYFYTSSEFSTRVGYFYIANPLTSAISALLAFGIFQLRNKDGWMSWQYMFLIEGLLTLVIGIFAFFHMPPSIVQTSSKWRLKGWYSEREEKIMVNRLLRDDPSKGGMHNSRSLEMRDVWKGVLDFNLWPIYACRFLSEIITAPVKNYLPIILKSMRFTTLDTNLLMIPHNFGIILTMQLQTHISKRLNQIGWLLLVTPIWVVPCLLALRYWPGFLIDRWGSYALIGITLAHPPFWPLSVSWASANSNSVGTRTISLALVNICAQLGCIVANNIFRMDDAPRYERGLLDIFCITVATIACIIGARTFYSLLNSKRAKMWSQLDEAEQREYTCNTADEGNRRLDFRFAL